LLFALITLVALALAATALVRSVDTGAIVLGNLSAKKATTIVADRTTQMAINYLVGKGGEANRFNDEPNMGYYASAKDDYDLTGFGGTDSARKLVNWDVDGNCAYATAGGVCDSNTRPRDTIAFETFDTSLRGFEARWLITRLCTTAGVTHLDAVNNSCAQPPKAGHLSDQGAGNKDYTQIQQTQGAPVPFYRLVVRSWFALRADLHRNDRQPVIKEACAQGEIERRRHSKRLLAALMASALAVVDVHAAVTDIFSQPLATTSTVVAKPNIMFILDNSGSMASAYMPDDRATPAVRLQVAPMQWPGVRSDLHLHAADQGRRHLLRRRELHQRAERRLRLPG
jgi:hypothetical protein